MLVPQLLHVGARSLAGHPASGSAAAAERGGMVRLAGRRGDFTVQRHGRLKRDQGSAMADVFGEGLVQYFGFFLKDSGRYGDSRVAQTLETPPRNQWIGI